VHGPVTLQGVLDLNVIVRPAAAQISNLPLLRLLGLRMPANGFLPATLIVQATNSLSAILIQLHVTGTVRSPTVQIRPISFLPQGAIRFFLNPANLPPG
jgi:hypothetical protein